MASCITKCHLSTYVYLSPRAQSNHTSHRAREREGEACTAARARSTNREMRGIFHCSGDETQNQDNIHFLYNKYYEEEMKEEMLTDYTLEAGGGRGNGGNRGKRTD